MELAAALLTCLVFYAVYYSRLGLDRSLVAILEAVLAGAVIALGLLLLAPHSDDFLEDLNPMSQGFLLAALPEKLLGLLALLYMTIRDRNEMSVKNSIGYGVLIGAGFSFVENIAYAWIFGSQIVYLRLFSSVSMHLTSMGLMGYLLGMGYLRNRKRWIFFLLSFVLPFLLHGLFDFSILSGAEWNYTVPAHIILPVFLVEAAISRSQTLPNLGQLREQGLWFEEWALLDRQRGYEKWIRSSAAQVQKSVSFFRLPPGQAKNTLALCVLLLPILVLIEPELIPLEVTISYSMYIALFVLLPASIGVSILSVGSVNPEFFRGRLLRIPIILDWEVFEEGVPAPIASGISYELSGRSLYLQGNLKQDDSTRIQFRFDRIASPAVDYEIVSQTAKTGDGVLVRIDRQATGFRTFQRRYRLRRLLWGLFYFLHFPGSEGFRKLFIKPSTITQTRRTYQAGDVVFMEGDPARRFYLVEKGKVQILRDTGSGPVALSTVNEGEIFGEMALVQGEERTATAICSAETVLSSAHSDHLESLIEANPEFASALIRTLVRRLIHSEEAFMEKLRSIEKAPGLEE
ncbi:MAG: cyclic nucleotide-binding domain-containing protein [Leptospiraceae bacterium]|nr:cyclic nucleotide-binding domain-containing protein [Leptospiraceae bacterium]